MISGPSERSKLAINSVLEPLIKDLLELSEGILAYVAGSDAPERVYLRLLCCV